MREGYKSEVYLKLQKSYMELAQEKQEIEEALKNAQMGNRILRAALQERRDAVVFMRFA